MEEGGGGRWGRGVWEGRWERQSEFSEGLAMNFFLDSVTLDLIKLLMCCHFTTEIGLILFQMDNIFNHIVATVYMLI